MNRKKLFILLVGINISLVLVISIVWYFLQVRNIHSLETRYMLQNIMLVEKLSIALQNYKKELQNSKEQFNDIEDYSNNPIGYNKKLNSVILPYSSQLKVKTISSEENGIYKWDIIIDGQENSVYKLFIKIINDFEILQYTMSRIKIFNNDDEMQMFITIDQNDAEYTYEGDTTKFLLAKYKNFNPNYFKISNSEARQIYRLFSRYTLPQVINVSARDVGDSLVIRQSPKAASWLRFVGVLVQQGQKQYLYHNQREDISVSLHRGQSGEYKVISISEQKIIFEYRKELYYVSTR